LKLYLDLGALLNLLLPGEETATVYSLVSELNPPFRLNAVHQLQVENGLLRSRFQRRNVAVATNALRRWRHYWLEGILAFEVLDLAVGFEQARRWNAHSRVEPPRWGLLLHPSLAHIASATHFLSLHPANRTLAEAAGLRLLPERL